MKLFKSITSIPLILCLIVVNLWSAFPINAEIKGYEEYPYSELFTEGKEWTLYHFIGQHSMTGEVYYTPHYIITVKVDGHKIIDGIDCKRLTIDTKDLPGICSDCKNWLDRESANDQFLSYFGVHLGIPEEVYVYEKDRKIYFYRDSGIRMTADESDFLIGDPYFDLYMDLNVSIGDIGPGMGTIHTDELIYIDGQPHRRITGSYPEQYKIPEWRVSEWIEGIGASSGLSSYIPYFRYYGPQMADMSSSYYLLAHVKENGKTIYDQTDVLLKLGLSVPSTIETVCPDNQNSQVFFDLQGRPIQSPQKGELFIQDGKIQIHK